MAEWSNVPDSKSGVRFPRTVGSNPTLSAKIRSPLIRQDQGVFRFGPAARTDRVASSMQPGCMMNTIAP